MVKNLTQPKRSDSKPKRTIVKEVGRFWRGYRLVLRPTLLHDKLVAELAVEKKMPSGPMGMKSKVLVPIELLGPLQEAIREFEEDVKSIPLETNRFDR